MTYTPVRPARETAITARRTACHDPASYDSTASHLSAVDNLPGQAPQGDVLDSYPGHPAWWPAFTKAMAGIAGAGVLLFLADVRLAGAAVAAGSAALWGLARIAALHGSNIP